jgi:tetratricopeptide (TPR) repeat protein
MEPEEFTTLKDLLAKGREAEDEDDFMSAAKYYQKVVMKDRVNEQGYDRLMAVYRKLKDYKKELAIIEKAIVAFQKLYEPKTTARLKKVAALSMKMAKSVGLVDKKGEATYEPEPLGKWKKRKLVVEKKINKASR